MFSTKRDNAPAHLPSLKDNTKRAWNRIAEVCDFALSPESHWIQVRWLTVQFLLTPIIQFGALLISGHLLISDLQNQPHLVLFS